MVGVDLEKHFDTVNQSKTIQILSDTIKGKGVTPLIHKFKDKIRETIAGSNGMSIEAREIKLNQVMRRWMNYFKLADAKKLQQRLDEWISRRIRMVTWKR